MKYYFGIGIVVLLLVLVVILAPKKSVLKSPERSPKPLTSNYHLACPFNKDDYLSNKSNMPNQPNSKIIPQALILTHHLLAKDLINEALSGIAPNYNSIILVGPNHQNLGANPIQTSLSSWRTPFGVLEPNQELINKLQENNLAKITEETFNTEHSVCGLISFLKIYFPNAKIIPLVLMKQKDYGQVQNLGNFLAQNCQNCLLIISVDFSHNVSPEQARLNDEKSIAVLTSLDEEKLNQVTIDSLATLNLLNFYLKEKGIKEGKIIKRSDSNLASGQNLNTVTSYLTIIF